MDFFTTFLWSIFFLFIQIFCTKQAFSKCSCSKQAIDILVSSVNMMAKMYFKTAHLEYKKKPYKISYAHLDFLLQQVPFLYFVKYKIQQNIVKIS